ncbi:metallophosphoesterase [Paenibacillus sp. HN-1]|uniref:metallophosphoesterase n=1 Tax=Paenibacillus TaxID=44249 RepID=UPI001CA8E3DA|nr:MULTISPECIES: metallophosphoesterase [Paenibacillus]MBY9078231.1 metallophosphoesterase [Paenibacillus sp. CGMCC 1.18879]MBY9086110.1 metallophosphoesterase [Paenibacillus sinensis]
MNKIRLPLLISLSLVIFLSFASRSGDEGNKEVRRSGLSDELYVATDLHYLSPELQDGGQAFQSFVKSGDSKLLYYSDELVNAWVSQIVQAKPGAVILSGDLTNNGEKISHQTLAKKLREIEDSGVPVYVIPGNHDILNPWARSFKGNRQLRTDYITPKEFESIYGDFGYNEAMSRDRNSLSYTTKLSDHLWLLMLDTSKYKRNLEVGFPETDGEISGATLEWISVQTAKAEQSGAEVIAVMHHNLMDHSEFSTQYFTLNNHEEVQKVLTGANIHLVLSGHIHIQDIRYRNGIYDISTSAFEVYPHQFGVVRYDPQHSALDYHTEPVDVEAWAERTKSVNPDLLDFRTYAESFFRDTSYQKAYTALESQGYTDAERQSMAQAMAELNLHYFAGTTNHMDPAILNSKGMQLWKDAKDQFLKSYVLSMTRSSKENNQLILSLPADKQSGAESNRGSGAEPGDE